jgi:hypothetical protein
VILGRGNSLLIVEKEEIGLPRRNLEERGGKAISKCSKGNAIQDVF